MNKILNQFNPTLKLATKQLASTETIVSRGWNYDEGWDGF